jgi:hypothetical protein
MLLKNHPFLGLLWRIFKTATVIYLIVVLLVYFFQRKLQYFPEPGKVPLPRGEEFTSLESFEVTTSDNVRLQGWYWPGTRPVTLLVFHGNAGHRGYRLEWLKDLHGLGLGISIIDYRGYGGSEGSPTETGLYLDAEAALKWLEARGAGKIVYLGESLGCAVAVEMALRHPPQAMVLQSGFLSAADIAKSVYPFLPVGLLMKDRYDHSGKAGEVACAVLVLHGSADSLIPCRQGRALFEALPEPKEWLAIQGGGHNDLPWVGGKEYLERIDAFVRRRVEMR